ncbi:MAG TPA: methyltransferase domain-containing protein [Iamia sp.]
MTISPRLAAVVEALPLAPGLRVLEIGCGPGVAARAVAARVGPDGFVLATDRSARAIAQAEAGSAAEIAAGLMGVRQVAAEDIALAPGEARYDLAFAIRVGAFDGRHPAAGEQALARLADVLVPGGLLYVDGGAPLRAITVG